MNQQEYLLGIDIGTGSTKAVAIDFSGQPVNSAQHYYDVKNPRPGVSEQDPEVIWSAFVACIKDTVEKNGQSPVAICLSSALHSLIPVDNGGTALADMITWADSRSEAVAERLKTSPLGNELYETSGTPIHAMSPLCKLIWLRENDNALFTSADKFISIKEYIWFRLFSEFQVDYGIASATGLFDIKQLKWNPVACDLAGITMANLSEPVNTTYYRADADKTIYNSLKLKGNTAFVIGSGDGCCANLGSFVEAPGIASLTIGTSGAVRITSSTTVINFAAMVFNYLLDDKTYICGGAVNNGGIALNWLIKTFMDKELPGHEDYDTAFSLIETVPAGSDGLLFLPYLYGERAPIWDSRSSGVFFNMKPQHIKAHFLRAGLEGICFALNDVLQNLERSSAAIKQLNISGGFITSPVWVQMLADITGKRLEILQQDDASAMGAVFLGMRALGIGKITQPAGGPAINPNNNNHKLYADRFLSFKKLYTCLKELMDTEFSKQ